MKPLELQSERTSPTGNLLAEGAKKSLGRPRLGVLTLLVRETIQNSWDARLLKTEPVHFTIAGRTLLDRQSGCLRETVFPAVRHLPELKRILDEELPPRVLTISDTNTVGLAGPTRADAAEAEGASRNFVSFLRNVGRGSLDDPGGGTYGYGKASLYLASSASAICVYTRCRNGPQLQSRFMAAALGEHFSDNRGRSYTGRHWWGYAAEDGIVDPAVDEAADEIALRLGLKRFSSGQTGTSIIIVDPKLGASASTRMATDTIVNSILWYCWPKMMRDSRGMVPMEFDVSWEGKSVAVPAPEKFPPLRGFARAFVNMRDQVPPRTEEPGRCVETVWMLRPKRELGAVSFCMFPSMPAQQSLEDDSGCCPIRGTTSHVALLRKPELVVDYFKCSPLQTPGVEYAGVFKVKEELNRIFADAESPAHDGWHHELIEDEESRSCVRVALRRISELGDSFVQTRSTLTQDEDNTPLGAFSRLLSGLVPLAEGPGPEVGDDEAGVAGGGGGGQRRARIAQVNIVGQPKLSVEDGRRVARVNFEVAPAREKTETVKIRATPVVVIMDGSSTEADAPLGSDVPRVLRWRSPTGIPTATGKSEIQIPISSRETWSVEVAIPDDAMVDVTISSVRQDET